MVWSYSRLTSFDECPYRWFLSYLYRDEFGRPLKKKSGFFAEFGSYIHMIMQMYLDGVLKESDLSTFYVAHFSSNVRSKAPGFIDLISEENGKLIITDHKSRTLKPRSNRASPTKSDLELDSYYRQLYVYSAPVKELYDKYPDALEFNCFRSQTMIQEAFREEKFHRMEQWSKKEIEKIIINDDWGAKPDYWRCHYLCDVSGDCEYRNAS